MMPRTPQSTKLTILVFSLFVFILSACSDNSNTTGGGTETDNSFATDTVFVRDTILAIDTVKYIDSIKTVDSIFHIDTVTVTNIDTVVVKDTITQVHDTIIYVKDPSAEPHPISGSAQKGPFINGSVVNIFELSENGLNQTGKSYRGKTNKHGDFAFDGISLKNNFAILEATGFFFNEVTGKESASQITMNAIVDFSGKTTANINLLTHLKYDRINTLVIDNGLSIEKASAQAEKEIFNTFFGIEPSSSFEDMNIFEQSEDNAMLLALSILTLADNDDSKYSRILADISADVSVDGSFDDENLRTEMADFAAFDIEYDKVRKNIENLPAAEGKTIPNFEKYLTKFWTTYFGIGDCTAEIEGTIRQNKNKNSKFSTMNFLCSNGNWSPYYFNPNCEYGTLVDERDGKIYRTTTIGTQTWMSENLRYEGNGYICYNNDEKYCKKYGNYYNYSQASCPAGYHLPDTTEWRILLDAVGGKAVASKALRAIGPWSTRLSTSIADDEDKYCFGLMPAGVAFNNIYLREGEVVYYYTSSEIYINEVPKGFWNIAFVGEHNDSGNETMNYTAYTVIRCVKDTEIPTPPPAEE